MEISAILVFLRDSLVDLDRHVADAGLPQGMSAVSFDRGWQGEWREGPRWDWLVWRWFELTGAASVRTDAARAAAAAIWQSAPFPGWQVVLPPDAAPEQAHPWAIHSLMPVLIDYLGQRAAFDYDESDMSTVLRRHIANWKSPDRSDDIVVPLFGLDAGGRDIRLDADTVISPFTAEAKSALWSRADADLGLAGMLAFGGSSYCVVAYSGPPRPRVGTSLTPIMERCGRVITALRLLKDGEVFAGGAFIQPREPVIARPRAAHALYEFRHGDDRIGAHYTLLPTEDPELAAVFDNLQRIAALPGSAGLEQALRRFNLADARGQAEDTIIDLAIALESTLLQDAGTELSFQIALRGATVLAGLYDPTESHTLLKALYRVRSKIVHSGKSLAQQSKDGKVAGRSIAGFVRECRRLTREILRFYVTRLANGDSLKRVNDGIERSIISRATRPD